MKILFIGDISGKLGRLAVVKLLPSLKEKHEIDLTIANAENSAHGSGVTPRTLTELQNAGVDYFTSGDHAFDAVSSMDECYGGKFPTIRPENYSDNVPGKGYAIIEKDNKKILLINLIGRVFMKMDFNCPFQAVENILANFTRDEFFAIVVDIHAEATSEKISLKNFLDGRVTAIVGTHTHVMTADQEISDKGTAYITDIGMTGFKDGCIGVAKEAIIETFLDQVRRAKEVPEKGRAILNAVILEIDDKSKEMISIIPIQEEIKI